MIAEPEQTFVPAAPYTMESALLEAQVAPEVAAQFSKIEMPFRLKPHQIASLQGALAWDRHGLFDEMRCGKSVVMAMAAAYFAHFGSKTILLMPPILFDQFLAEFASLKGAPYTISLLNQTPKTREKLLEGVREGKRKIDILVMTKEIFKIHLHDLLLAGYTNLFYDECHMGLQSCETKTKKKALTTYGSVQFFMEHAKNGRLILSTGTPLSREAADAYPMISLKTPHAYQSKREFDYVHVTFRKITIHGPKGPITRMIPDTDNYMNVDLLTKNIFAQSTRALRLEVLDCQRPNIQEIPVRLSPAHMTLYKQVLKERLLEIDGELIDARSDAMLRVLAMQLIVNPGFAGQAKIENNVLGAIEILMGSMRFPESKLLLFANYNESVEFLARTYSQFKPATIYGPNGSDKNRAEVARFKSDPACPLAIANPISGGVGLTLGKVCQTIVVVEPMSTPGQFEQASSRIILAGQTEPVSIYLLRVLGTIAPKAIDVMLGRAQVNKDIMMDRKSMLDDLLDQR